MFRQHADHVVPRFAVRGHTAEALHGTGPGVVGGQRQHRAPECLELGQQIPRPTVEVLSGIVRIDAEHGGRARHQLRETDRAFRTARPLIEPGFLPDHRTIKRAPLSGRQTGRLQSGVMLIAGCGRVDAGHDADIRACGSGTCDKRGLTHCRDESVLELCLRLLGLFLLGNDQPAIGVIALDRRRSIAGLGAV
mgnify:CR=1 FL=1